MPSIPLPAAAVTSHRARTPALSSPRPAGGPAFPSFASRSCCFSGDGDRVREDTLQLPDEEAETCAGPGKSRLTAGRNSFSKVVIGTGVLTHDSPVPRKRARPPGRRNVGSRRQGWNVDRNRSDSSSSLNGMLGRSRGACASPPGFLPTARRISTTVKGRTERCDGGAFRVPLDGDSSPECGRQRAPSRFPAGPRV